MPPHRKAVKRCAKSMRILLFTILILLVVPASAQKEMIWCRVSQSGEITNNLVMVTLSRVETVIHSIEKKLDESFYFDSLELGCYTITIHQIGRKEIYNKTIELTQYSFKEVSFHYPKACPYDYPAGFKPNCPLEGPGHKIVPIFYGLPSVQDQKRANVGLIKLGGCEITGCDPGYYCQEHKQSF